MANKEYIERDLILNKNMLGNTSPITYRTYAEELIKSIPSADVVEVVRCKNCKYRASECEPEHGRTQHYCTKNKIFVNRDFFCGYGARTV